MACHSSISDWAVAGGTIALAIVAVFQQWLQRLFVRPKLKLDANVRRPDSEKTILEVRPADVPTFVISSDPAYYFRLAVRNVGNAPAHDVQVYLASVERQRADGNYESVEHFSPMNLMWTHLNEPTKSILLPKMPPVYCDMVHVVRPKDGKAPLIVLDLEVPPNSGGHILQSWTRPYRFHLILAASDCDPIEYKLEVNFPGQWFDDQDQMFREGFGMHLL